jgi:hypothetical protein
VLARPTWKQGKEGQRPQSPRRRWTDLEQIGCCFGHRSGRAPAVQAALAESTGACI